ncbi:MAG: PVC-type heme-binding CxxCH protein, partial [Planctomycetota bacterium]
QLFADEVQFPDLINPVQMAWDTRGRLWVAAWVTYPHWEPDLPMNDKLLILEDVDGDGHADTCKVFAGDLHNPTGFEFWNGGVLVANAPDILFLKDTDGDDRADLYERVLHGLSSGDTHHSANSFVMGPGGAIYFQEGTFHQTQVETIRGPVRNHNGCVWRFDPRTWLVERYTPYNFANPHGHVFDRWGQDFVTDGTGNVNYYALPFSGFIQHPQKHSGYFPFFKQRSRPCAGTEILSSSHFPQANQGNYLIANVIGFQGLFQYEIIDDGSGFGTVEVEPIVFSADRNFRPTSIEVGPDGALYVLDWHNAIVGHLQHHLRDPSRDRVHGRIYRITYEGRELLDPPQIAGSSTQKLLELLKSPEDRVRYRTRIELSAHDSDAVVAATAEWVAALDSADPDHEHHLLEALWLHQQHNRVDLQLLRRVLRSEDHRARAAATRVLRYMRHKVPNALQLLAQQAVDDHPRVRLEAVVGASFFDSSEAASVALETLAQPSDRFLDYALKETMRALEPRWKEALRAGHSVAADNPAGIEYLLGRVSAEELLNLPRGPTVLQAVLTRGGVNSAARLEAAMELAQQNSTTPAAEVLSAVYTVDRGNDSHAMHVLHDLGMLLRNWIGDPDGPSRTDLAALASSGQKTMTRELGYAALVAFDHSVERAWESASTSIAWLVAFLGGVAMIEDADLRSALHDRVRPLMYSLPVELRGDQEVRPRRGTGLSVSFYEPSPKSALVDTLDALTPLESLHSANFTLELPPAQKSDSYGLLFRGTIF